LVNGAETTGNFVNGKTLHVKYVYEKRPVEKKGSFQEHHIYQTKKLPSLSNAAPSGDSTETNS
jgi:hypothetical protein